MWLLLRIEAPEYLKRGRGVIIGQLLDRRTDMLDLIVDHPTLAQQYERLVNEVNTPLRQTTSPIPAVHSRRKKVHKRLDKRPSITNKLNPLEWMLVTSSMNQKGSTSRLIILNFRG
ncbi:hypothetical protein V8E54_007710 [Elaphomyces granulatus]